MIRRNGLFPVQLAASLISFLLLAVSCVAPAPVGPPEETAAESEPTAETIEEPQIPASEILVVCRGATTEVTLNECTDPADPAVTYTYTDIDRAAACVPIVPFDPDLAWGFTAGSPGVYLIGWTFGVNFEVLRGESPIGCLRMWARDDVNQTYVPIDQGGILVDTCSHPVAAPDYGDGAATFDGSQRIECVIDLNDWFTQPNLLGAVSDPSGSLPIGTVQGRIVALAALGGLDYDNFAIVAAPSWNEAPDCADTVECLEPLMSIASASGRGVTQQLVVEWQPATPPEMVALYDSDSALYDRSGEPCYPVTVTTNMVEPDGMLGELLQGAEAAPEVDAPEWQRFWWMMPSPYRIFEPTPDAEYRYQSSVENPQLTSICLEPEKGALTFFDMAKSWLVIGADPNSNATFQGVLEGVLIDPSDSKPPE